MNIGLDVDGVIFNIEDYQITEGQKYFKNKPIKDINGYGIKEVFDCSSKEEFKFWLKKTFNYNRNVVAREGMAELIKKLRENGNRVYIITSRAMATEDNTFGKIMRNELEKSLIRNGIEVDGIIYTPTKNMEQAKKDEIKKYNIHVMIEDKKEILDYIKNDTQAICFNTRNNHDYNDDKVIRIFDVNGLKEELDTLIYKFNSSKMSVLSFKEIENMSNEEKIKYYNELREYYKKMMDPYYIKQGEDGCNKVVGKLQKIYNFVYRPHVIHKEKMPTNGGIILASNHLHSFDPLLLMTNSNMPFHLLAKSELHEKKILDKLFTTIGSIFVDNKDADSRRKAKEDLIKVVLNGGVAMMFPEGTRNKTEKRLLDFHMGTVNVAQITKAPIYPFAINSDYKLFNNNLCMSIGDPIYINENDNLVEKNEELKEQINNLLDEVKQYEHEKSLKLKK